MNVYTKVVCPYNGVLLCNKKERSAETCHSVEETQKYYVKWKKPVTEDRLLYDSILMKCPASENL